MYPSVENAGRGSRGRVNGGRVTLLSCGGSQPSWLCAFMRLLSLKGLVLGLMLCCDAPGIPHF